MLICEVSQIDLSNASRYLYVQIPCEVPRTIRQILPLGYFKMRNIPGSQASKQSSSSIENRWSSAAQDRHSRHDARCWPQLFHLEGRQTCVV